THYSMARPGPDGVPSVNLEADAVRDVLELVPTWTNAAVENLNVQGLLPSGIMEQYQWWRINFWSQGAILTHHCNAWELGRVATVAETGPLKAVSNDWDLYPFPSTATRDNTVRLLLTPWAIFNYAMDDGDPALSDEEMARLEIAFSFMMFYMTDNRAWEARAAQEQVVGTIVVEEGVSYLPAISTLVFPSFPVVTGPDFDFQLNTMFSTESLSQLADADRFPGFHKVMDIMQNGDTVGVEGTAFPWYVEEAGAMVGVIWEWQNVLNPYVAGAAAHDAEWLGNVLARLPEWNRNANERLARADQELRESLERWYGRTFD
ncbi:MAG: hypothetical protein FWC92_11640, partial [Defluviitaleaceae bacterium]|nr:hypothetical protein [Defluviitaleaceae bacterium]